MEFFDWFSISQIFYEIFSMFFVSDTEIPEKKIVDVYREHATNFYVISLIIAAVIFAVALVMGGIGLKKLAQKEGKKHSWLGFLPFANTYYAGEIAGETNFFGLKMKRAGLYAMLAEIGYFALETVYVVVYILSLRYLTIAGYNEQGIPNIEPLVSAMPSSLSYMYEALPIFYAFAQLLSLVRIIFFCVMFSALFRKYYARSPFLMTFLCSLLPLRGFILFAVRNNSRFDYDAYMRQRTQEYMRRTSPYGTYSYQNHRHNDENSRGTSEPFSDFSSGNDSAKGKDSSDDNPFSDF